MNLEQQVVSLDLSRKLKELGVKQESLFYWSNVDTPCPAIILGTETHRSGDFLISAFTVAELGEILNVMVQSYRSFKYHWECVYDIEEIGFKGKTEADVRAKMLIYLIENGVMEVPR